MYTQIKNSGYLKSVVGKTTDIWQTYTSTAGKTVVGEVQLYRFSCNVKIHLSNLK